MPKTRDKNLNLGWRRVKFGDVVQLSKARSRDPLTDGLERYVGLEHLDPGDIRIRSWGNVADGVTFTSVFQPGQVLFGKRRAYQRKMAVADFSGVCSGDIYVLETKDPRSLLPELLPFICQTDAFFDHAVGTSAGSLSPRTNWTSLAQYGFSLPSLDEQRRILKLLSTAQEVIDSLMSLTKPAMALQSSRLDSILWQSNLAETDCRSNEYFRVPRSWKFMTLPELVTKEPNSLTAGPFGTIFKARDFRKSGVPIIQLRHVTAEGFRWGQDTTYMDAAVYENVHVPYTVRAGDVLITKMGEPPGLACIYPEGAPDAMVTPDVIKAGIFADVALPAYVVLAFNNLRAARAISKFMKGGTRTRVSLDNLYSIRFPIPSLEEQAVIVDEMSAITCAQESAVARLTALKRLQSEIARKSLGGGGADVH